MKEVLSLGHDISSYDQSGKEIAYIRFTAYDLNAALFYNLFDASAYDAGVSGSGARVTVSVSQVEKALKEYRQLNDSDLYERNPEFLKWQRKEMLKFIQSCLETAQKEGKVEIAFC